VQDHSQVAGRVFNEVKPKALRERLLKVWAKL
jgi:hypothetical protein